MSEQEKRRVLGWGIKDRDGDLWTEFHTTRSEAKKVIEKFFEDYWRNIKRRRGLSLVKVEIIESDWEW